MSNFTEERKEIETLVAITVDQMDLQGAAKDLGCLFKTLHNMQVNHTNSDLDLTLVNALLCHAAIERWLEAAQTRAEKAETTLD